jgi:hypothetical protein
VDDVLAEMKDRLDAIQKEAGVSRLVSKWDEKTLKRYRKARQVEVTDRLLREFKLTAQQKKIAGELRQKEPLPLDQAEELIRKGEL